MAEDIVLVLEDPDQKLEAAMNETLAVSEAALALVDSPPVPFVLDGSSFPGIAVISLKRSAQILDGDNVGRTTLAGEMQRDIIGTFYNYSMQIDSIRSDPASYSRFYDWITAPVDYHNVTFPYNQQTISGRYYVSSVEDVLDGIDSHGNHWSGLTVNFIAMGAARTP